jgi:nitroreductase
MQVDHQEETGLGSARELERIIMARHSTRSFLAQAVDKKLIEEILTVAGWAPSGNNIQPWRVHVVSGAMRQRLVQAVCRVYDAGDSSYRPEYHYYPLEFFEPYLGRRRQSGWGLYGILGIQKGESARMQAATQEFRVLLRAGRADVYHRPAHAAGQLA